MKTKKENDKNIEMRATSVRVHIVYTDDDGKRKPYTKTFFFRDYETKTEAVIEARKARDEFMQRKGKGQAVSRDLNYFYDEACKMFAVSVKTRERHKNLYAVISKQLGDKRLDDITLVELQELLNQEALSRSDDNLKRIVSILHKIYQCAIFEGYTTIDITQRLILPKSKKPKRPKREDVTDNDIEKMEEALLEYNHSHATEQSEYNRRCIYYIFQFARYTGMRPAEILALQRSDLSLVKKSIFITKSIGATYDKHTAVIATKTEKSTRVIPISSALLPVIEELLSWSKHNELFALYDGSYWNIDRLSDSFGKIAKSAGLKMTLYDLRHHFATRLMRQGVPPAVVRDLMGHSSLTMSIEYARSSEDEMKDAIEHI